MTESRREHVVNLSGIKLGDRSTDLLYPTAGQGIEKRTNGLGQLPIVEVQHLSHAPTLKSWVQMREGKFRKPEHETLVSQLRTLVINGCLVYVNVDNDGFYDFVFSGSNGNMTSLDDLQNLQASGFSWGECLWITKLVCGPGGQCDNGKPCPQCKEIGQGTLSPVAYKKPPVEAPRLLTESDEFDRQVNAVLSSGPFIRIGPDRIMSTQTRKSCSLGEIREVCNTTDKGVLYALDVLGVHRGTEAASNSALKRSDLGGH